MRSGIAGCLALQGVAMRAGLSILQLGLSGAFPDVCRVVFWRTAGPAGVPSFYGGLRNPTPLVGLLNLH